MKLDRVKPGAIVKCRKLGMTFLARVIAIHGKLVDVEPLKRNVSYRRLTARQIIELVTPAPVAGEQLGLGGVG